MTWGEFKKHLKDAGVKDSDIVGALELYFPVAHSLLVRRRKNADMHFVEVTQR